MANLGTTLNFELSSAHKVGMLLRGSCTAARHARQVVRKSEAHPEKILQWRRLGMRAIREGKTGLVLLCGGGGHRVVFAYPLNFKFLES